MKPKRDNFFYESEKVACESTMMREVSDKFRAVPAGSSISSKIAAYKSATASSRKLYEGRGKDDVNQSWEDERKSAALDQSSGGGMGPKPSNFDVARNQKAPEAPVAPKAPAAPKAEQGNPDDNWRVPAATLLGGAAGGMIGGLPGAAAGAVAGHELPQWGGWLSGDNPVTPTDKGTPGKMRGLLGDQIGQMGMLPGQTPAPGAATTVFEGQPSSAPAASGGVRKPSGTNLGVPPTPQAPPAQVASAPAPEGRAVARSSTQAPGPNAAMRPSPNAADMQSAQAGSFFTSRGEGRGSIADMRAGHQGETMDLSSKDFNSLRDPNAARQQLSDYGYSGDQLTSALNWLKANKVG